MYSYFTAKQTLREKLQSPNVRSLRRAMILHNRGVSSMSELDVQTPQCLHNSKKLCNSCSLAQSLLFQHATLTTSLNIHHSIEEQAARNSDNPKCALITHSVFWARCMLLSTIARASLPSRFKAFIGLGLLQICLTPYTQVESIISVKAST
jgi:hypothetical protein